MSMKGITAADLIRAAGGRLLTGDEKTELRHISLDSRSMEGDDLFVPIVGEKVDAHNFICQALGNGAAAVITSEHHNMDDVGEAMEKQCHGDETLRKKAESAVWIQVEDTRRALQDFGSCCRSRLSIPLVGITGSVGKTTTREMIAAALQTGFSVYKTPGNSNSQVGVPITIAQIPASAGIGVIELGMSDPGEMTKIARIARVNCAVITNIGVTHIEQLGSRENILKEKLHIQDGMDPDGFLLLNGDDQMLRDVVTDQGRRKLLYGMSPNCQYRGEGLHLENGYPVFTAVHGQERVTVRLKVMGSHMASNALAALAVAGEYGIPLEKAARGLEEFEGYRGRQQVFEWEGVTVIDDSYNASPVSMKAGLEVLCSMTGKDRRIAVLADMKELGPEAPAFHREIGACLREHPVDALVVLGDLAAEIGREAKLGEPEFSGSVTYCESLEQVETWLDHNLRAGDCVLLKGSNSMGLSRVVGHLKEGR